MLILLGDRDYETQVGSNKLVLGALTLGTSLANLLCQLYFLVNTNERCTSDFHQIFIQCLA